MKATKIFYKKLFSLGNYENEEIGIELQVEEGEKASDVLKQAKQFVETLNPAAEKEKEYRRACEILNEKDGYNYRRVIEAQEIVRNYEENTNIAVDLPF